MECFFPVFLFRKLQTDKDITDVICIHSETTSGIINPVEEIGAIIQKYNKNFIVDAMSSFGAVPVDFNKGSHFFGSLF